jgi:hypothetical protein
MSDAPKKGWPVYIWLPVMVIVGFLVLYMIAGVPTGH